MNFEHAQKVISIAPDKHSIDISTFIGIIMLVNGKFWKDVRHAVNCSLLWGKEWDWKQEQIERGLSLFS